MMTRPAHGVPSRRFPQIATGNKLMLLKKDMLKPGIYAKGGEQFVVGSDDINEINRSVQVLQDSGYKIPLWLEHPALADRLAYPIPTSNESLLQSASADPWFAGWLTGISQDADQSLHVEMEVPEHLGTRLANVGTFVSPQFGKCDAFDSELAKTLPNALHHLALTRNPVNRDQTNKFHEQKNFGIELDTGNDLVQDSAQTKRMSLSEAFASGSNFFRFSLSDAVTNAPNPPNGTAQGTTPPTAAGSQPNATGPEAELKNKLQQALQAMGITLDPNSTILQDAECMTRVLGMIAGAEAEAISKAKQGDGQSGASDPYSEQSTVIAMSNVTPQTPVTPVVPVAPVAPATPTIDPVQFSAMQAGLVKQQTIIETQTAQLDGLTKLLTNQKREAYSHRIKQLSQTGRIADATKLEKLNTLVGVYQFSATAPAETRGELDIMLEIYEGLPAGAALTVEQQLTVGNQQFSGLTETGFMGDHASRFSNPDQEPTDARAEEILKELLGGDMSNYDLMVNGSVK